MGAAATTTSKTTTDAKKRSSAAVAEGKRRTAAAKNKAAAKAKATAADKQLIATARKNPGELTVEQRRKIATAAVPGLKGKARKLWIDKGETPTETVKRNPAPKKSAAATDTDPTPIESGGSVVYDRAVDMLKMLKQAKQPVTIVDMKAKLGGQHPQYLSMLAALEATGTVKKYRVSGGKVAFTLA